VAGPIVRYAHVAPQIARREVAFDDFAVGVRRFIVGLGKKVLIANQLATPADAIFALPTGELTLGLSWLGAAYYTLQIYFDFSGYSDMAIGLARMFGFRFLENFDYPYVARSVREFWQRWHISLSTWFRDYLYVPLGGNRVARPRWLANLFITFLVSGLWHGARWTFVVWGALHGAYLIASLLTSDVRERIRSAIGVERHPRLLGAWQIGVTFVLVCIGWVFFRAASIGDAAYVLSHLFTGLPAQLAAIASNGAARQSLLFLDFERTRVILGVASVIALLAVEHLRGDRPLRKRLSHAPFAVRWTTYAFAVLVIMTLGVSHSAKFIYFQF